MDNAQASAYPSVVGDPGMTKREYFAAHAPAEPQAWFSPVMAAPMPEPVMEKREGFMYARTINQDDITAWKLEELRQRALQWPWAWADAMLACSALNGRDVQP